MSCWAPEHNQDKLGMIKRGCETGESKDKLFIWAFWILMARKVFIIVLVYRHGIHGNLVFPSYLVILYLSEYSVWGSHLWNLLSNLSPYLGCFQQRRGVEKGNICKGPDAWKCKVLGEARCYVRLESRPCLGKGQKPNMEKVSRKQIRAAFSVSTLNFSISL